MLMMSTKQGDRLACLTYAGTDRLIDQYLALFVAAPRESLGVLPITLGLGESGFTQLFESHFPDFRNWFEEQFAINRDVQERSDLRTELMAMRNDEIEELVALLEGYRNPAYDAAFSTIIAAGCMGGDHLWRDLGFPDRGWLSDFMALVYPQLKAKNDKDMKWKRFLYKQLCEGGGHYVCRAPSCEECSAFSDCFGPED